jgi:hypothetical protein
METKGVPLDFILSSLNCEEYVIDWIEFVETSIKHHWKLRGTLIKIESSIEDIYGVKYSNIISTRLNESFKEFL